MERDLMKLIETWFMKHAGDGEFSRSMRHMPYSLVVPLANTGRIMYTTKPMVVAAAIEDSGVSERFGIVGRPGLPDQATIRSIHEMTGSSRFLFLGDMDPVDLMIYLWMRATLPPDRATHYGINDAFLQWLGVTPTQSILIRCSSSERQALGRLHRAVPDYAAIIGSECARILEKGFKIELELMLSVKERAASALQSYLHADSED